MTEAPGASGRDGSLCGGRTRAGGSCRHPSGWGTDTPGTGACRNHAGNTSTHRRHAERIEAERAVARFGLEADGTPAPEILLREIGRSSAMTQFYAGQVAGLAAEELVWGTTKRKTRLVGDGEEVTETEQEARPNVWLLLLDQERKTLRALIETAHKCNIEERMVRQAELEGALMVKLLNAVLTEFRTRWELTREQVEWAGTVVAKHLRLLGTE